VLLGLLKRRMEKLQQISCHARNFPRFVGLPISGNALSFMPVLVGRATVVDPFQPPESL